MKKTIFLGLKQATCKQTLTMLLMISLLMGSFTTLSTAEEIDTTTIQHTYQVPAPTFIDAGIYNRLELEGITSKTGFFGGPELAVIRGSHWLSKHATNIKATLNHGKIQTGTLAKPLTPTQIPKPLSLPQSEFEDYTPETFEHIYHSHEPFGEPLQYNVGYGIKPDGTHGHVISYTITPCYLLDPAAGDYAYFTGEATLTITYDLEETLDLTDKDEEYDLLILSPNGYLKNLQRLVNHKEDMGLNTKLVSLDDIYNQVYFEIPEDCSFVRDNQEKIKYFMYQAIREWDVEYVLAVGGYRSFWGLNRPDIQFPIRWIKDIKGAEEGYATELYYSCCMSSGGAFDDWDSNNNDIFGEVADVYDRFPDVHFGRLACRNNIELKNVMDKIIYYETNTYDEEWFNRFMTIGGDGFQDLGRAGLEDIDLEILWDVNETYPDGDYTIYAQSYLTSDPSVKGNIDVVGPVTIDRTAATRLSFEESDHLKIEPLDEEQETMYPGKPVAEIVVPSNGDIIGNTDFFYAPPEAYCSDFWAWGAVSYTDGVLKIRTKSYDPSPKDNATKVKSPGGPVDPTGEVFNFASRTNISVWINNSDGETVFGPVDRFSVLYYEGELGCQYAIDFMDGFDTTKLWTSNGNFHNMWDVIDGFSDGYGFVYMHGHSSCMSWMDHYPGVPGGRVNGGVAGIASINMRFGLERYAKGEGDPLLPIDHLYNGHKLPVLLFSGCHSGQFDTSFMRFFTDPWHVLLGEGYGTWVPEGMAWWITRIPQGGTIATIGNTALGYGYFGEQQINGLGGWLYPEFLNQYNNEGHDVLGKAYTQTLVSHGMGNATLGYDRRTHEIWALLGDPSLQLGGYPPETSGLDDEEPVVVLGDLRPVQGFLQTNITNNGPGNTFDWTITIAGDNPLAVYLAVAGTIFEGLFKGRVLSGGVTSETEFLGPGETVEISSGKIMGIGHINVNLTVTWEEGDEECMVYQAEDGFVLGGRLFLYHGRE